MTDPSTSTVASAEIARLAEVGRAEVSNWRRRFTDFPSPVGGTAASPPYRLSDVESWLRTHGRAVEITPLDRVWQDVRSQVDDLELDDAVGCLGGLLVLLVRAPQVWTQLDAASDDDFPRVLHASFSSVVPEFPTVALGVIDPVLVGALRRVAAVATQSDPRAVLRFLIGRFHEAAARRVPMTPDALAGLVADLAAVAGRTVLDPACGTAALLATARSRGAAGLAGQDTDAAICRIAAARLLADGGGVEVAVGDSLRANGFPGRLFGAVVCEPPFGERAWGHDELGTDLRWQHGLPPRGEPELAWVQHCLSHAEPGGRVVVSCRPRRRTAGPAVASGATSWAAARCGRWSGSRARRAARSACGSCSARARTSRLRPTCSSSSPSPVTSPGTGGGSSTAGRSTDPPSARGPGRPARRRGLPVPRPARPATWWRRRPGGPCAASWRTSCTGCRPCPGSPSAPRTG